VAADMSQRFTRESLPPAYDRFLVPKIFEPWARILLDAVDLRPGEAVLDVATGPGTVARAAATRVGPTGRVVGVDISQPMLAVARGKPRTDGMAAIEFLESPATALPVPDTEFDVVLCQQGMQFFPDRALALVEMRRALRPGGRLGAAVWAVPVPSFAAVREAFVESGGPRLEEVTFGRDPNALPSLVGDAGFDIRRADNLTLTITYEGGVDEVIEHAAATPTGGIEALAPARRDEFRQRVATKLQPFMTGDRVVVETVAKVVVAAKPG
jgi:SAM-dependent methyltransferase